MMDATTIAVGLAGMANVLAIGTMYGKLVTRMENMAETMREHSKRTAIVDTDHTTQLRDHSNRITRLETKVLGP